VGRLASQVAGQKGRAKPDLGVGHWQVGGGEGGERELGREGERGRKRGKGTRLGKREERERGRESFKFLHLTNAAFSYEINVRWPWQKKGRIVLQNYL
jgi:hypothetical protein